MSGLSRGSGLWNGNTGLWHGNTGLWSGATGLQDGAGGAWSPLVLFAAGEQGVWYDPSDFTTMFQDTTGATPVTAVGQRIALLLDKSKGLVESANLLVGTWSFSFGTTESPTGTLNFPVSGASATQPNIVTAGKTYVVRFTAVGSGNLNIHVGDTAAGAIDATISTSGTYTFRLAADAVGTSFQFRSAGSGGFVGSVSNYSVKELPGNHGTRTTTAQQPILRQTGGGLYYAEFDGIDDSWVTGNINFSATDEMTVIAGVRKLAEATNAVVELSATSDSTAGTFLLATLNSARMLGRSRGSSNSEVTPSGFTAPTTVVLSLSGDISTDSCVMRSNGAQVASSASDQGTGNYASAQPLFVGRRGGTTIPFNGWMFGLIVRGKTTSGDTLANAETYMAEKTGVTI